MHEPKRYFVRFAGEPQVCGVAVDEPTPEAAAVAYLEGAYTGDPEVEVIVRDDAGREATYVLHMVH